MKTFEYDENGYIKPPIGFNLPNDQINKETMRFEWNDAIGNKVKKNITVFNQGLVEKLLL